jgi:signal transduction histidine kinase
LRHNIFLIVKEALTNALKHGAPKEVHVGAKVDAGALEILVRDDGHGFDSAAPPQIMQDGLENMRRRAAAIGGKLTVTSAPGQGTSVQLAVRLPN